MAARQDGGRNGKQRLIVVAVCGKAFGRHDAVAVGGLCTKTLFCTKTGDSAQKVGRLLYSKYQ